MTCRTPSARARRSVLAALAALVGLVAVAPAAAAETAGGVPAGVAVAAPGDPITVVESFEAVEPRDATGAETSAAVPTGSSFSLVGLELPPGAAADLRASADGVLWTPWTAMGDVATDGPSAGTPEASRAVPGSRFTEPVWVGPSRWLQVRVDGAAVGDVRAHLVDPSTGVGPSPTKASLVAGGPRIVSRAGWGADESLRTGTPRLATSGRYFVLHHTATANDYTAGQAAAVVRGMYQYHTKVLGWDDIGYNVLIDRFGTIYEGRAGGIDKAVVGAHAGGFNTGSVGLSVIGEFGAVAPPTAALDALVAVAAWKASLHGIDPTTTLQVTSGGSNLYPSGTPVTMPTFAGHRDVGRTACPGDALYALLPKLRTRIAALRGQVPAATPPPTSPPPPPPSPAPAPAPVATPVSAPPPPVAPVTFSDIAESAHEAAITRLAAAGVVRGCGGGRFCPGVAVTRGQAATLVVRAMAGYEPIAGDRFSDVPGSDPHAGAVNALAAAGVLSGFKDGTFRPDAPLTRGQMAAVLQRALRLELVWGQRFTDVPAADVVYRPRINALAAAGVVGGCTTTRYCPAAATTRAQLATFVARSLDRGL